ncbi:MAG: DNA/RNA-binding protein Alba 2 [Promethearchaeota archaeon]|nr:MAG: DNA/RNA-binding protein Alba 2 [Candidatus Lokiarchaeota archaeon]
MNNSIIKIRKRAEKNDCIKTAIFALSGGKDSVLICGEGKEISTAVEIAEILRQRMGPAIEISDITLGSRPFYRKGKRYQKRKDKFNDIISQIEIEISKKL